MLTRKDVRQLAGQVIQCGFEGRQTTAELRELLREVRPLGLILFARNLGEAEEVAELNCALKSLRPREPLLLSVDQEGGRVARLVQGVTQWPAMRRLGDIYAREPKRARTLAHDVGQGLGRELRTLGFDLDYAPVLDVDTNPQNPVIGDRSFSDKPEAVGILGAAVIAGLQGAGVAACGKHFPGHGDTDKDSHHELPYVEHALERLRRIEWPPFVKAIQADVAAIMTAHVVALALDRVPATVSPIVIGEWLRRSLAYDGVIIGDDIDMKALSQHMSVEAMGPAGLNAGLDSFLACRDPEAAIGLYRGIVVGVERGTLPMQTLKTAAMRCQRLHQRWYQPMQPVSRILSELASWTQLHAKVALQLSMG